MSDPLLQCAVLCNDSKEVDGSFRGDPTEVAVLIPAYKAGLDVEGTRRKYRRVDEIPFSAERKMMSTINSDADDEYAFVKGAPEELIPRCTRIKVGRQERKSERAASHALPLRIGISLQRNPAEGEGGCRRPVAGRLLQAG